MTAAKAMAGCTATPSSGRAAAGLMMEQTVENRLWHCRQAGGGGLQAVRTGLYMTMPV